MLDFTILGQLDGYELVSLNFEMCISLIIVRLRLSFFSYAEDNFLFCDLHAHIICQFIYIVFFFLWMYRIVPHPHILGINPLSVT